MIIVQKQLLESYERVQWQESGRAHVQTAASGDQLERRPKPGQ